MDFWELTPREFILTVEGYGKRSKAEQEERIMLTYLGAYWNRVKKMPDLKEILKFEEPKKNEQSAQAMLDEIKRLNAAFGGDFY